MPDLNTMPEPYRFLEKISTEELRRLLREDLESEGESSPENDEFITHVMEVVAQREESDPSAPVFDPAAGWEDFQTYYYPTEQDPILLCDNAQLAKLTRQHRVAKRSHPAPAPAARRSVRRLALVAAAIGVFMTLLVAAQASGLDVFGAMARWTDETFRFVAESSNDEVAELRSALEEQGIPAEYAPSWIPENFQANPTKIFTPKDAIFIFTCFSNGKEEFQITITRFPNKKHLIVNNYEKDANAVIPYSNGRQLFYIFDNLDSSVATWSDGETLTIEISGQLSLQDMKSIIDSIGGQL